MRKLSIVLLLLLCASGILWATPVSLGEIMNDYRFNGYFDTGSEVAFATKQYARSYLFLEKAGYRNGNRFGIYGFNKDNGTINVGNKLELFTGCDSPIHKTYVTFFNNGNVRVNGITKYIGSNFGFYLDNPLDQKFYSHTSLNNDGFDHMMLFNTKPGIGLKGCDIMIAVEDLWCGGDRDYNDMVVGIRNVQPLAPVPEPATLLLLGFGLVGILRIRKKKNK